MNELQKETSPYLLQHSQNPVHWKAWNSKSLETAATENKLIIVSVGYSACHWCHVMEHESFEDTEVASVMNRHFISIKVDREERPDVDAVYMKAVQIMTSRGGWPMNVVCLPNGKPIWGGTYFRKTDWMNYLAQLQELFVSDPEKLLDYSEQLQEGMQAISVLQNESSELDFNLEKMSHLVQKWKKSFDWEFGGMARAPKFMMPVNYEFLLDYAHQTNDDKLVEFVHLTLTKMAYGGLFDTIDGGFSRYSVDMKWHVPHFEKMLYDNGQLVSLYSNAYKLSKNNLYKEVIEKTLVFVEKEFLSAEYGFYAALDADSLTNENHLEEGAFYVWTTSELKELLNEDFKLFSIVFNINEFGFWENDTYVLIQNKSLSEIAKEQHLSEAELHFSKIKWEKLLYSHRERRSKPRLDDKCLCSWNALMLKGFIDAYKALENDHYLEIALKNAAFIQSKFLSDDGSVYHNYKNGHSTINGYLEDYCFVIEAFIGMYQITLTENWLYDAKQLTDYCLDNFYDEKTQFFRFTSSKDDALIATHFEIEDNVIPASNSVMAHNLLQLSVYFSTTHYEKIARQMVHHVVPNIDYPSAFSNWLKVYLHLEDRKELAICSQDALHQTNIINAHFLPEIIIAGTAIKSNLPFLKDRYDTEKPQFYICKNQTCELPLSDFEEIKTLIFCDNLKKL